MKRLSDIFKQYLLLWDNIMLMKNAKTAAGFMNYLLFSLGYVQALKDSHSITTFDAERIVWFIETKISEAEVSPELASAVSRIISDYGANC